MQQRTTRRQQGQVRIAWALLSESDALAIREHFEHQTIVLETYHSAAELTRRIARGAPPEPCAVLLDLDLLAHSASFVLQVQKHLPQCAIVALGAELVSTLSAELLAQGVPSLQKPVTNAQLASVLARLSTMTPTAGSARETEPTESSLSEPETCWHTHLRHVMDSYAAARSLSRQQQQILQLYLAGDGDKEIACAVGCSPATVYEHWRRMGKKAGGASKQHVIADFHRFLAGG